MRKLFAAAIVGALLMGPAAAQSSLSSYDAVRAGLLAVWDELPLSFRNVSLTDGAVTGYGAYVAAADARFAAGEKIHVYAEVLGYGWRQNADNSYSVLLDVDLNLKTKAGKLVASEDKLLSTDIRSRSKNLETYLSLDATLTGFAAGDYVLEYEVHDRASGKQGSFSVPVSFTP